MPPAILYSLVSRDVNVLAESTEAKLQGNFTQVARVLLKKIPTGSADDGKMSYVYDEYVFHYQVTSGLIFLCMADKELSRVMAFRFLEKIQTEFDRMYGARWKVATAYQFNADFKNTLEKYMKEYSSMRDEKIGRIQDQISDIKTIMTANIDKVLERGEKIEMLVDKSQQMEQHAFKFHKSSVQLRRRMCCNNAKWWIIAIIIVLIIIYVILAFACDGPKLPKCIK